MIDTEENTYLDCKNDPLRDRFLGISIHLDVILSTCGADPQQVNLYPESVRLNNICFNAILDYLLLNIEMFLLAICEGE